MKMKFMLLACIFAFQTNLKSQIDSTLIPDLQFNIYIVNDRVFIRSVFNDSYDFGPCDLLPGSEYNFLIRALGRHLEEITKNCPNAPQPMTVPKKDSINREI